MAYFRILLGIPVAWWMYSDAKQRFRNEWLPWLVGAVGLLLPLVGGLIYLFVRRGFGSGGGWGGGPGGGSKKTTGGDGPVIDTTARVHDED